MVLKEPIKNIYNGVQRTNKEYLQWCSKNQLKIFIMVPKEPIQISTMVSKEPIKNIYNGWFPKNQYKYLQWFPKNQYKYLQWFPKNQ